MAVNLTEVTGPVLNQIGETPTGGKVKFVLTGWDKEDDDSVILQEPVEVTIGEDGAFSVDLYTTTDGDNGVVYDVYGIFWKSGQTVRNETVSLGRIALSGSGPFTLATLLSTPIVEPTAPDVLAECIALAAAAAADAAQAAIDADRAEAAAAGSFSDLADLEDSISSVEDGTIFTTRKEGLSFEENSSDPYVTLNGVGLDPVGYGRPPNLAVPSIIKTPLLHELTPAWFIGEGAAGEGDYDYSTGTGTEVTTQLQDMINVASEFGTPIRLDAGKKYLTDTLHFNYDATDNPDWDGRAGGITMYGGGPGIATGSQEDKGSAFVHVDGSSAELIKAHGDFSVATPGGSGIGMQIRNINLIGGDSTTSVLDMKQLIGACHVEDLTVRVYNSAGDGIVERSTWESSLGRILVRGDAAGDGAWTGVGLRIIPADIGGDDPGQTNMKDYRQVNCYRMGYGWAVGRDDLSTGQVGPLVIIGGQGSGSDYNNLLVSGCSNINFTGFQSEGSRLNGVKIDGTGGTELPRAITFENLYLTNCGEIEDGSDDCYAFYNVNGQGVHLRNTLLQNVRSGILFEADDAADFIIDTPTFRTVSTWGAANGVGIGANGSVVAGNRHELRNLINNNPPATLIGTTAEAAFSTTNAGGRLSVSDDDTTPSLSLGSKSGRQAARVINFNNSSSTSVTDIDDGQEYQTLICTFSNLNTTIVHNSSLIYLKSEANFTPTNTLQTLHLTLQNGVWREL